MFIIFLAEILSANFVLSADSPKTIIINEIAWMGTLKNSSDEWIELYNKTDKNIPLQGWTLKAIDKTPTINLEGIIPAQGFYLLERTDDNTVSDIPADQIYVKALSNSGEILQLFDSQDDIVDEINCKAGWIDGDNQTKQTMERKRSENLGIAKENWQTSQAPEGTPKSKNSPGKPIEKTLETLSETPEKVISQKTYTRLIQDEKQINRQNAKFLSVLLTSLGIAIFSGAIILFLKKKLGKNV